MQKQAVVVLDFGAQYNQLIARRIRECSIYCVLLPYNTPLSKIMALKPKAIIMTGGPSSVSRKGSPKCDSRIFGLGIPILGICYGMQLMGYLLGGKVGQTRKREYGHAELIIDDKKKLFSRLGKKQKVWM
ncbi:MAG: gamma-glutamyl-gamma-aminobutyrate hydrolase family protein, partial [Candidatus Omnitrophica bacterium]|nr:gamma-glutamyl-gamma-aminobutyrate hydrolase family protein [Candidatus Omnitrophota bacterium]